MITRIRCLFLSASLTLGPAAAFADVNLPAHLSDHMVLQQGMPAAIWGTADGGETVRVRFREQEVATTAGQDGKWKLYLPAAPAGGPFELTITARNTITLRDVVVGEIWVCSGQSNMQWPVERAMNADQEAAAAENPQLRCFTVKHTVAAKPMEDVAGKWEPSYAGHCPAVH